MLLHPHTRHPSKVPGGSGARGGMVRYTDGGGGGGRNSN